MQQPETFSPLATRLSHRPVVEARAVPGYDPIFNAGLLVHEGTTTCSPAASATDTT